MSFLTVSAIVPPATVLPFAASTAPDGWLICDGSAVSRTTYAALFASVGTSYGSGDGSTTFNLPDFRWAFLRGHGATLTATGSGTAASNNATFTAHPFTRTGIRVRLSSGTLSGLAAATTYWVIVVDSNTLAFATSRANAFSNTKVAISGANSAVLVSAEDPDSAARQSLITGATTGPTVGSFQDHELASHRHLIAFSLGAQGDAGGTFFWQASTTDTNTGLTGGNETRPMNISVNYIIKF